MKWLILLVIVCAGAFFGYPLVNENAGSECDSLERAAVRLALGTDSRRPQPQEQLLGQFIQGFSKGQFASVAVRNEYPNVPVTVACTMLYWRVKPLLLLQSPMNATSLHATKQCSITAIIAGK